MGRARLSEFSRVVAHAVDQSRIELCLCIRPETDVRSALYEFDQLWNELFPAEQARIIQLLVERVDVGTDGVDIRLRVDGITSLVSELIGKDIAQRNAA